jgi:hypothetical protein
VGTRGSSSESDVAGLNADHSPPSTAVSHSLVLTEALRQLSGLLIIIDLSDSESRENNKWTLDMMCLHDLLYKIFNVHYFAVPSPGSPGFVPRSGHVGFVVDKEALGQVFSKYFGFPYQFSFHRLLHTHHTPSGAGRIGQLVADVPNNRLSLTPPQETKKGGFTAVGCESELNVDIVNKRSTIESSHSFSTFRYEKSRDSSVGMSMGYCLAGRGSILGRGKKFFSARQHHDRF